MQAVSQVNLLAANNHNAASWTSGSGNKPFNWSPSTLPKKYVSGIFTSSGPAAFYHNLNPQSSGKLLVADLPVD